MSSIHRQDAAISQVPLGTLPGLYNLLLKSEDVSSDDEALIMIINRVAQRVKTAELGLSQRDKDEVTEGLKGLADRVTIGQVEAHLLGPLKQKLANGAASETIWQALRTLLEASKSSSSASPNKEAGDMSTSESQASRRPASASQAISTPFYSDESGVTRAHTRHLTNTPRRRRGQYSSGIGSLTAAEIQIDLFDEVRSCVFRKVDNFEKECFHKHWTPTQERFFESLLAHKGPNRRWPNFPSSTSERLVRAWLVKLLELPFWPEQKHMLFSTSARFDLDAQAQLDAFFAPETSTEGVLHHRLKDILVVGELKSTHSPNRFKDHFLQLARYALLLFRAQPLRLLVHAFLLCGSKMETFVFDRSAISTSGFFDVHLEPERFSAAIVSYATMATHHLGVPAFCTAARIDVPAMHLSPPCTYAWEGKPISKVTGIVGRATTCFKTTGGHIIKFSWLPEGRQGEGEMLRFAEDRGVKNVARLLARRVVISTGAMRGALRLIEPHQFRNEAIPHSAQRSLKRKASFSNSPQALAEPTLTACSTRPPENLDRSLVCIVTSPAGRVLSDFKSIEELLKAMLDAIVAHRSLYEDAGILHRDICPDNIIIVNRISQAGTPSMSGMLIDLDASKRLNDKSTQPPDISGHRQYMAIGVLFRRGHTYRDDLESFLYVLLWMGGYQAWINGLHSTHELKPSNLDPRGFARGKTLDDAGWTKYGAMAVPSHMPIGCFTFPASFHRIETLCVRLRNILFAPTACKSDSESQPYFEVPDDVDELYSPVITAFETVLNLVANDAKAP